MSTNEFARILLTWIKSFLSWIGIPRDRLNELDEIIFLILIVVIAFAVGAVFHYLSVRFTRKVLKYKNISFLSSLIEYNALRKMSAVIPPLIISALLPFAFDYRSTWFTVSEKITWIYFFIALLFSVNAVLNSVGNVLMNKEQLQNRPMKGFIQIFQVIFSCVAIIRQSDPHVLAQYDRPAARSSSCCVPHSLYLPLSASRCWNALSFLSWR